MTPRPRQPSIPVMRIEDELDRYRKLRGQLERAVLPLAQSLDGRRFTWQASLHDLALRVGGYVVLETARERRLGQILDMAMDETGVAEIGSAPDGGDAAALRSTVTIRLARGHGAVLEGPEGSFHDARLRVATPDEVGAWAARRRSSGAPLTIGDLSLAPSVAADIDARGFGRHTFLCGQSGSGKTHALGVLLEQLLARTSLRIVVLDPNSDFASLREVRPGADAEAAARHRDVAAGVQVRSGGVAGPARLHVRFTELEDDELGALLRLDPIADRDEYAALLDVLREEHPPSLERLAEVGGADGLRLTRRAANLGLDALGIWSRGDPRSLGEQLGGSDWRCLVVDIGSLATRTEAALAAECVLGGLWRRRAEREPVLIVIDEAHNVCPAEPTDALTALATDHVVRIAAEGRKFGMHLLLCTQRPQKVPENAISQCDNLVLMRMNSVADASFTQDVFSFVPAGLLALASTFGLGEALVAGRIAADPTLVRFGQRVSREGGADVPTTWAVPAG